MVPEKCPEVFSDQGDASWVLNFFGASLTISDVLGITKMSPNFSHVLEIRKSDPSSKLKSVGTHLNAIFY